MLKGKQSHILTQTPTLRLQNNLERLKVKLVAHDASYNINNETQGNSGLQM